MSRDSTTTHTQETTTPNGNIGFFDKSVVEFSCHLLRNSTYVDPRSD